MFAYGQPLCAAHWSGDNEAMASGLIRCGPCGQANQAIPTLLVLRRGQVVARQTGAAPLAVLRSWVGNALADAAG